MLAPDAVKLTAVTAAATVTTVVVASSRREARLLRIMR
jgi:hypothetical protein